MAKRTGNERPQSSGGMGKSSGPVKYENSPEIKNVNDQNLDPLGVAPELDHIGEGDVATSLDVQAAVQRYWVRFLRAEVGMQKKHELWRKLDTYWRGEQWKDKGIPPWIPKPVTNMIRYAVTTKRANIASAISRPTFFPVTIDDTETVYKLQLAHDHVWDTHRVDRTVRKAISTALLLGTAIAYVYNDADVIDGKWYGKDSSKNALFQGDIRVKLIEPANFFPDPDAYCLEECKFIETTEVVAVNHVKQNPAFRAYCAKNGWLEQLDSIDWAQIELDDDASGTIYKRDNYPNKELMNIAGDENVTVHAQWERYRLDGEWHVNVTYYLRNTSFFLLRLEDVQPNVYPFAILEDEEERNDFWGTSTSQDIMENQNIINKVQQVATVIGALHQNPQKIVFRESGINAQEVARTGNMPGKAWTSNTPPNEAMINVQPPEIPPALFDLDDRTQNNIKMVTGLNEAYVGDSTGSLTTSTGVDSLIERATVRDKDKMIQVDAFVEALSHLIVAHILHKWVDPRPLMTIGLNGIPEFSRWEPVPELDRKNITWRVRSYIYAKAPVTQASRRQQADKLMQMQGQFNFNPPIITPEEWIVMQEFDNGEQILQRMQVDRQFLQRQQTMDMAQVITQVANHMRDLEASGAAPQSIQQQAYQMAQQLVQQQQQQEQKNGQQANAPAQSQAPQGTTSQVAMANMANGS